MKPLLTQIKIQLRLDIRNRGTLLTFYIVPLLFYIVMGSVFSSIMPAARNTLMASMTIFGVTMGAILGIPGQIVSMRESGMLKSYRVSGIKGWSLLLSISASAFINLTVVSVIIALTAPLLFSAGIPVNIFAYFITAIILISVSITVGLLVGVMSKSQSSATIISQAIFLPSLLLSGIMFPAAMLPAPLQWLGYIFPAAHAMQAFAIWSFGEGMFPVAAISIMIAIGIVAASITLFRYKKISMER